jgi:site-specific DNA-methyltransferase (adenine-specific)/modification methylase
MRGLDDNAFDICITSPPYNMNLRVNSKGDGYCSRQIINELSTKYTGYDDNLPMEEYEEFITKTLIEIIRVSNLTFFNIQMITGNKPALFRVLGAFADQIKEIIIWDKCKSQPAICDGVLNSGYEFILVLGDKPIARAFQKPNFNRGELSNIWRLATGNSSTRKHKAAYTIKLPEFILKNFAHDDYNVFDPFLGTGTTAIAAHYANCNFVGCELDEDYFKDAQTRIERETAQIDMF